MALKVEIALAVVDEHFYEAMQEIFLCLHALQSTFVPLAVIVRYGLSENGLRDL